MTRKATSSVYCPKGHLCYVEIGNATFACPTCDAEYLYRKAQSSVPAPAVATDKWDDPSALRMRLAELEAERSREILGLDVTPRAEPGASEPPAKGLPYWCCRAEFGEHEERIAKLERENEDWMNTVREAVDKHSAAESRVVELEAALVRVQAAEEYQEHCRQAAEARASSLSATLGQVRETLRWLDRLGGLGYDKHDRIRADIAAIDASLAPVAATTQTEEK